MPTDRAYCRFRLIGWTAATGEVLFSVDLTNYAPGDPEESYSWLETAPGLVLTVHRERLYVTVLSTQVGSHSELSREGLSQLLAVSGTCGGRHQTYPARLVLRGGQCHHGGRGESLRCGCCQMVYQIGVEWIRVVLGLCQISDIRWGLCVAVICVSQHM